MKRIATVLWKFFEVIGQYRFEQAKRQGFMKGY
jgi:uncharacterized protein YutD